VPLPETIAVKYTEEEAEYLSMRPVVRQTFRAAELVDMIVQVAGKNSERVRQILRGGTVVFHSFRYWWQGFEADAEGLGEILARYPDADPSRVFRAEDCVEIMLESSGSPPRHSLRVTRREAGKRGFLRGLVNARSFWDRLMNFAKEGSPRYREYSYVLRADVYSLPLSAEQVARLAREAAQYAPGGVRAEMAGLAGISQMGLVCKRGGGEN
jgi:hypothetical protein